MKNKTHEESYEEYQMDFDKYDSEGLHCKPMLEYNQRTYDGITVNVGVD